MSTVLRPTVYVDNGVSTIAQARSYAQQAEAERNELKQELWGLVMATPRDIAPSNEDPITNIKERFNSIWEDLWDAFVDDYKYTAIADDAEYVDNSLVKKQWDDDEEEERRYKLELKRREKFFKKYEGVLNPYSFDDGRIYEEWVDGNLELGETLTKSERDEIVKKLNEQSEERMKDALKALKQDE